MDEKKIKINVDGDASGLDKEMKRVSEDTREAFDEIGLKDILDSAEKSFERISDKIKNITEALKGSRVSGGGSDSGGSGNTSGRGADGSGHGCCCCDCIEKITVKSLEVYDKWKKLAETWDKKMKDKKDGGGGSDPNNPNPNPNNPNNPPPPGNSLWERALGKGSIGGGIKELLMGQGGLASMMGLSGGALLAVGGIATMIGAAVAYTYKKGLDDYRLENTIMAKLDIGHDKYGDGKADVENLGMSQTEFKDFSKNQMKSMMAYDMDSKGMETEVLKRLVQMAAYGLSDSEVSSFDRFKQADTREAGRNFASNQNSAGVITDILIRSEKSGLLGVSGKNFTLLPQKIEQVANILEFQKRNNEEISTDSAVKMMIAGTQIGGRFGDDRAGEAFGRIDDRIKNPSSPGMKAFMFDALKRQNPSGSYTDILGKMEGGATKENLEAILPSFNNVKQGEYRRMLLYQLTGNWQDAIRLDKTNGGSQLLGQLGSSNDLTDKDFDKKYKQARDRGEDLTDVIKQSTKEIVSAITSIGNGMVQITDNAAKGRGLQEGEKSYNQARSDMYTGMFDEMSNWGKGNNVKTGGK